MNTHKYNIAQAVLAASVLSCTFSARACERDQFFHPHDAAQQTPLARPHADFEKTQRLALAGVPAEERNLAALYESGHLVSQCPDKALYWYSRAADHGDERAREWLEREKNMARLRSGPECFGGGCSSNAAGTRKTVIIARPNGMFRTSVNINGKTREGTIDTGATFVSMSAKLAQELGIDYTNGAVRRFKTANGTIDGRMVKLDAMSIGNVTLNEVDASVKETDVDLLIGMSFLRRLAVSTNGNAMTLVKP